MIHQYSWSLGFLACVLVVTTLGAKDCGKAPPAFRIVKGSDAYGCDHFPWMIQLENTMNDGWCGGSLIDSSHVLTAAHCVYRNNPSGSRPVVERKPHPTELKVHVASTISYAGKVIRVKSYRVHQNYFGFLGDIAVLELDMVVKPQPCLYPICLPDDGSQFPNRWCYIMGWGLDETGTRQTNLKYRFDKPLDRDECRKRYLNDASKLEGAFCGLRQGSVCTGDSGGPVACPNEDDGRTYIYGIVSSTSALTQAARGFCGRQYGRYTNVTHYLPWIKEQLNQVQG